MGPHHKIPGANSPPMKGRGGRKVKEEEKEEEDRLLAAC